MSTQRLELVTAIDKENVLLDNCHDEAGNIKDRVVMLLLRHSIVKKLTPDLVVFLREGKGFFALCIEAYKMFKASIFLHSEWHHWSWIIIKRLNQ